MEAKGLKYNSLSKQHHSYTSTQNKKSGDELKYTNVYMSRSWTENTVVGQNLPPPTKPTEWQPCDLHKSSLFSIVF